MMIQIIGAGYVGLVTGLCIAKSSKQKVYIYEVDQKKRQLLQDGICPFHEPGVDDLLKNLLKQGAIEFPEHIFAGAPESKTVTFICVGTPSDKTGRCDLQYVEKALDDVTATLTKENGEHVVAIKSTVQPGTTIKLSQKVTTHQHIHMAMVPEFLREGSALEDGLNPDRILLGSHSSTAHDFLKTVFSGYNCPLIPCTPTEAELSKYTNNTLLALLISFSNEISTIAEKLNDCDVHKVMKNVLADKRWRDQNYEPISIHSYLDPGCGFGGSCFPKDVRALTQLSKDLETLTPVIDGILSTNSTIQLLTEKTLWESVQNVSTPKIALLGLAFKANTSDTRESATISIAQRLSKRGARVTIHDPQAELPEDLANDSNINLTRSVDEALEDAHLCALMTGWPEYKQLTEDDFLDLMERPFLIDGRGFYRNNKFSKLPYKIYGGQSDNICLT